MGFDLHKLFIDVFAPVPGDRLTIMVDIPHGEVPDNSAWAERREMAACWQSGIKSFADNFGLIVHPIYSYRATGVWAGELPHMGWQEGRAVELDRVIGCSTILISMPEYSATPSLVAFTKKYPTLRAASMPLVSRSMEKTALAADYELIAVKCAEIARRFNSAVGMDVLFSTGHRCYFDKSDRKIAREDNGRLHPNDLASRMCNLPSGEVYVVPREDAHSQTSGELPVFMGEETFVLVVHHNRIVEVKGDGPLAKSMREGFRVEPALTNVAEVAIGCNDKAVVSGNVLEDEKAGFHWAYGRSDFIGGDVGLSAFITSPVTTHRDIVYAAGSRISCVALDYILADGQREPGIRDGKLLLGDDG